MTTFFFVFLRGGETGQIKQKLTGALKFPRNSCSDAAWHHDCCIPKWCLKTSACLSK